MMPETSNSLSLEMSKADWGIVARALDAAHAAAHEIFTWREQDALRVLHAVIVQSIVAKGAA